MSLPDSSQVFWALQNSFHHDQATRNQAEQILLKGALIPGFTQALMQLINTPVGPEISIAVKQAATIQLRQRVSKYWQPSDEDRQSGITGIGDEEKHYIRESVCEALINEMNNGSIRKTLCAVIRTIIEYDYPTNWPGLLPKILHYITQQDQKFLYPALLILRLLCKAYHFRSQESGKREPLSEVVTATFPVLIQLANAVKDYEGSGGPEMQVLIGKIFWSSIQFSIPPYLLTQENFMPWMNYFAYLLTKQVPPPPADLSDDMKQRWPWWSAKKRAAAIFNKLFHRYGTLKGVPDNLKGFAVQFVNIYALRLLEAFLTLLNLNRSGQVQLPDRLIQIGLEYLSQAVRVSSTFKVLKPNAHAILTDIVFPLLVFSDEDALLWEEDPLEFIRREFFVEEYFCARHAARDLLFDLVSLRGVANLDSFMIWLVALLQKYNETPPAQRDYRQKDGALTAVGHLHDRLMGVEKYKGALESMVAMHVLPEFESPHGYLRAKACWIFSQFHDIEYQNKEVFFHGLQSVLRLFKDPELPVRVRAACSLRGLIRNELAPDRLYPILPQVLDEFFALMNEIDNDDLVGTLEEILETYGEKIEPYAIALCERLSQQFLRLAATEDDSEDESASLAAIECLNAIQTILEAIHTRPQLFPKVEEMLFPMLNAHIRQESIDFFEEIIRILSFVTYYSPTISPTMWTLFPKLYQAFDGWAVDYIGNILIPMDNYISRSTDVFLAPGAPYLGMVFSMYQRLLSDAKAGEIDVGEACKLIEVVLHNCRGRVDNLMSPIVELAVRRLIAEQKPGATLRVLLLEVIANSFYYNPQITLQVLEQLGFTQQVFGTWMQNMELLKRIHDKKVTILGLSSLFLLSPAQLPPLVQSNFKLIIQTVVHLLQEIQKQKKQQEEDRNLVDEEEDFDDLLGGGFEEVDVPENEDISGFDQELSILASAVRDYGSTLGDDEEDDDFDLEEEEDYTSPIDSVDELIFFMTQLQDFARREPQAYGALSQTFTPQEIETFNQLNAEAENRKNAAVTTTA